MTPIGQLCWNLQLGLLAPPCAELGTPAVRPPRPTLASTPTSSRFCRRIATPFDQTASREKRKNFHRQASGRPTVRPFGKHPGSDASPSFPLAELKSNDVGVRSVDVISMQRALSHEDLAAQDVDTLPGWIEDQCAGCEVPPPPVADWFTLDPDQEYPSWRAAYPLDQDLSFSQISSLPVELSTPASGSLAEQGPATDVPELGALSPETLARNGQVEGISPRIGLPQKKSRYAIQKLGQGTTARPIPVHAPTLDPLQRWRESPPEDEPASMSAIMQAVNMSEGNTSHLPDIGGPPTITSDSFRHYRGPVSVDSSNSGNSVSSWQSSGSRQSSSAARNPLAAQSRTSPIRVKKSTKSPKNPNTSTQRRIFPCTFCCDTFNNKHDWARHERTLHLNLGGWMCCPHGGTTVSPSTGRRHCAFCSCLDPSPEHLAQHNYSQCSNSSRTFRRKDHLVQHLRLVHRLDVLPVIDTWKTPELGVSSRCGFCDGRLKTWNERVEHLASHFRDGVTMKEWHGTHGFPPSIAEMVTNSLPPYLIFSESTTVVPFSATNSNVKDHFAQISHRANGGEDHAQLMASFQELQATDERPLGTFTELLTRHLGRYARQQMSLGIVPTDEMFQDQARRLLYDSEDSWNQTIADNPEWIASFRQEHTVDFDKSDKTGGGEFENHASFFNPSI